MNDFDNNAPSFNRKDKMSIKVNDFKACAEATARRTKTTVIRVKVGRIAISAIKASLRKTPGIPASVKMMLDSEYADVVIGAVVPLIVPMITTNERAIRLGEDVAIAGGVAIADKLTFIDDFVADVVSKVTSTIDVPEREI